MRPCRHSPTESPAEPRPEDWAALPEELRKELSNGETPSRSTQDEAFRALGPLWSGTPKPPVGALLALQRPEGGWGQVPTMASDAYATDQLCSRCNRPA